MYRDSDVRQPIVEASKIYKNPIVAEIGVYRGRHAEVMYDLLKPKELHLIDPWNDPIYGATDQLDVYKKFKDYSDIYLYSITSMEALKILENKSFDLAYIDGAHDFRSVDNDIRGWWPKIVKGGMLALHDYNKDFSHRDNCKCGVKEAVDKFANDYNLNPYFDLNKRNVWFIK